MEDLDIDFVLKLGNIHQTKAGIWLDKLEDRKSMV